VAVRVVAREVVEAALLTFGILLLPLLLSAQVVECLETILEVAEGDGLTRRAPSSTTRSVSVMRSPALGACAHRVLSLTTFCPHASSSVGGNTRLGGVHLPADPCVGIYVAGISKQHNEALQSLQMPGSWCCSAVISWR
jgi:hypothetical protein